jgi:mono/diheme cytochrome c family protein
MAFSDRTFSGLLLGSISVMRGLPPYSMPNQRAGLILGMCLTIVGGSLRIATAADDELSAFLTQHCVACHSDQAASAAGNVAFELTDLAEPGSRPELWERVIRKLSTRQMPPVGEPRPSEAEYVAILDKLQRTLDAAAVAQPQPGRTATFRRLTRTEYQNAIRDLLAVEIDAATLLPPDELSHGFDNITVTGLSPVLLNRALLAAQKVSRLAVGGTERSLGGETFRVRPDLTQDAHIPGLPIGTRGGTVVSYHFPQDGEYEIQAWLMRDRNEEIEGLRERHELEFLLDRERLTLFPIAPPAKGQSDAAVDAQLKFRTHVTAGKHLVGVTFLKQSAPLLETLRQPLNVHFNYYRHPRIGPAVYQLSIIGPIVATGPGDSDSRRRVFSARPTGPEEESAAAETILRSLIRRAWRRPVTVADVAAIWPYYTQGRAGADFEAGLEQALSAILVFPEFLFRIERDPVEIPSKGAYRLSDLELASRLSFFLWSSLPDEELLSLAEQQQLSNPDVLTEQVMRMLRDPRALALVTNFGGQWLHLRNLHSAAPDMRLYPDFDDNLRQAMRRETELLLQQVIQADRSVLELLRSDGTFLNERLAKHYGVPHVYGSEFRPVADVARYGRGGILRHGSLLTVTSYATRTSPVLRGKWVLENILGTPPPPPPENVPALEDNTVEATLSVRERLAQHREHAACAGCHNLIDPVGLSFEHFDAVGRWRIREGTEPIDARGGLADGSRYEGVEGLETALLARPELFVRTVTEKLLTYALGRGLTSTDAPAVRRIVSEARRDDDRFSAIIQGIVRSVPFQMRQAP